MFFLKPLWVFQYTKTGCVGVGGGDYNSLNSYPLNRDCVVVYTYVRVKISCVELEHYTYLMKYRVLHLMYWGINTCVQVQNLIKIKSHYDQMV